MMILSSENEGQVRVRNFKCFWYNRDRQSVLPDRDLLFPLLVWDWSHWVKIIFTKLDVLSIMPRSITSNW